MQELHPAIHRQAHHKAGGDNAKHDVSVEQNRDKDFDPQVSFRVSTTDKIREGYLHL